MLGRVLVLAGVLVVAGCGDERDTVARVVHRVADAAELKNIDGVMAFVAPDYRDPMGRDRARIRELMAAELRREERISIVFRRLEVGEIRDDRVTATLKGVLAEGDVKGASISEVLPRSMGAWRFTLELRRDDGRWLITRGEEQSIPPATFLLGG
ncbi:MAG: hypothetical protein U5S82_10195 [Gammaproteobacteria bacterium]|nr:hypothetical protein [Gammaproteobacteria bacterium]